jgi:hypothetical protein
MKLGEHEEWLKALLMDLGLWPEVAENRRWLICYSKNVGFDLHISGQIVVNNSHMRDKEEETSLSMLAALHLVV